MGGEKTRGGGERSRIRGFDKPRGTQKKEKVSFGGFVFKDTKTLASMPRKSLVVQGQ